MISSRCSHPLHHFSAVYQYNLVSCEKHQSDGVLNRCQHSLCSDKIIAVHRNEFRSLSCGPQLNIIDQSCEHTLDHSWIIPSWKLYWKIVIWRIFLSQVSYRGTWVSHFLNFGEDYSTNIATLTLFNWGLCLIWQHQDIHKTGSKSLWCNYLGGQSFWLCVLTMTSVVGFFILIFLSAEVNSSITWL